MPYRNSIKKLEDTIKLMDNKLQVIKESTSSIPGEAKNIAEQRQLFMVELSRLRKLQWEEEHERVNMDEDR